MATARRRANASTVSADDDTNCISSTAGPAVSGYDVVAYWSLSSGSSAVRGHSNHSPLGNYRSISSGEPRRVPIQREGYAPQFGGFCSWGIAEESVWTSGHARPGRRPERVGDRDGKLYLFMYDLRDKWLGEVTDDDLDVLSDTSMYVADAEARWSAWFGAQVVFNTACYWRNAQWGRGTYDPARATRALSSSIDQDEPGRTAAREALRQRASAGRRGAQSRRGARRCRPPPRPRGSSSRRRRPPRRRRAR